jgi:Vps16, N-terminal region
MANPTADWERLGDKYYRKVQLYTAVFDQDLELENYVVTGCPYGGAIGMSLIFRAKSGSFLICNIVQPFFSKRFKIK